MITMADVLAVLPFTEIPLVVTMTGEKVLEMLEWSVYSMTGDSTEDLRGAFLQYSGIQVTYDLSQPDNSKVVSAQIRCANCSVHKFSDLNVTATYSVIMSPFIYRGSDDHTMLPGLEYKAMDATSSDIVIDYLRRRSPVDTTIQHRITFRFTAHTNNIFH